MIEYQELHRNTTTCVQNLVRRIHLLLNFVSILLLCRILLRAPLLDEDR
jgi:hypothetical protein